MKQWEIRFPWERRAETVTARGVDGRTLCMTSSWSCTCREPSCPHVIWVVSQMKPAEFRELWVKGAEVFSPDEDADGRPVMTGGSTQTLNSDGSDK